jgi:hypothetical protein
MHDPLLQQPRVVTFHQLEAALERRLDPTVDVCKTVGHLTPLISQATMIGFESRLRTAR